MMLEARKYTFINEENNSMETISSPPVRQRKKDDKKQFKNELLGVFRKFGYFDYGKDYEVKFRTTSGNVAWVNINSIETIK